MRRRRPRADEVQIVEVETGLTIKASEVTDKVSKVFDIIKELNEKIIDDLDIKLSKDEKNALEEENASIDVVAYFSKGLEYEDANEIDKAKQMYIKALKKDKNFEPAKKRLMEIMK